MPAPTQLASLLWPECAVCGRPVERMESYEDPLRQRTHYVASCHGESERAWLNREQVLDLQRGALTVGPAFVRSAKLGAPDGPVASLSEAPPTAVKQLVGSGRAERATNAISHRNPAIPSREGTPGVAGDGGPGAEEGAPGRTRST